MRTHGLTARIALAAAGLALGTTACADGGGEFSATPPFEETEHVKVWATTASAVAIYSNVHRDIAIFHGEQSYADEACPLVEDDGTTWTASGDCTDSEGQELAGKLTIERDGDDFTLGYDGFRGHRGTFSVRRVEPELHEFRAQLVFGGFTTVDYMGTVQGSYEGRTIWNGTGRVERDGFVPPNGVVQATTLAEIVDDQVCAGQPVAGSTTLTSGEHVAVITYDGETDCDEDESARLTVDDEDRGLVEGINCAVASPGAAGAPRWVAVLLLGACLMRRRRAA